MCFTLMILEIDCFLFLVGPKFYFNFWLFYKMDYTTKNFFQEKDFRGYVASIIIRLRNVNHLIFSKELKYGIVMIFMSF